MTWLADCARLLGLATFMHAAGITCSQRLGDLRSVDARQWVWFEEFSAARPASGPPGWPLSWQQPPPPILLSQTHDRQAAAPL